MGGRYSDEILMQRCIQLASKGMGRVFSNPLVGALILHNHKIIAEGCHEAFGGAHAEPNAIYSVNDKTLLNDSTLYVNLEPCSHFGKTPPCVNLIIASKIPRVIIGTIDPNPLVSGKGVDILRKAGIEVKVGVLEKECEWLNRRFFTYHKEKRTYVVLKWAQSADGFLDILRNTITPAGPNWITNEPARQLVHKWRSMEMSIMTGTNTVIIDNPKLNVREWPGKDPLRIVLDRSLRIPKNRSVFDKSIPTTVFTEKAAASEENLEFYQIEFDEMVLDRILKILFQRGIQSVFVEGGAKLLQAFIDRDLWDEARVFYGPEDFVEGVKAPVFNNFFQAEENNIGKSKYKLFMRI
jgi:diaminohydroxyphosphoribosylaminopyrimidine deaminase / 5-amino-6-(5-phosphoribosylamino)uracil reductase